MKGRAVEDLRWLPLRAGRGREEQKRDKGEEKAGVGSGTPSETAKQRLILIGWAIHESYFNR
jgi:hypothetical protein